MQDKPSRRKGGIDVSGGTIHVDGDFVAGDKTKPSSVSLFIVLGLGLVLVLGFLGISATQCAPLLPAVPPSSTSTAVPLSQSATAIDLTGHVTAIDTGADIRNARVTLEYLNNSLPTYTDSTGQFSYQLVTPPKPAGANLRVEKEGFETYNLLITVPPVSIRPLDIRLNANSKPSLAPTSSQTALPIPTGSVTTSTPIPPTGTPMQANTAAPGATHTPTSATRFLILQNKLLSPVNLGADTQFLKHLPPQSTDTLSISKFPTQLIWYSVPANEVDGRTPLGEVISGTVTIQSQGGELTITNAPSPSSRYFAPVVTSNIDSSCTFIVNEGEPDERRPNLVVPPHAKDLFLGYYHWTQNSNVFFHCDYGNYIVGRRATDLLPPIADSVEPYSGAVRVTLRP